MDDFFARHLPQAAIEHLADQPTSTIEDGATLAARRRICVIYGVATCYAHPRGEKGQAGWNKRLLASRSSIDPEAVVEEIFHEVWQRCRDRQAS